MFWIIVYTVLPKSWVITLLNRWAHYFTNNVGQNITQQMVGLTICPTLGKMLGKILSIFFHSAGRYAPPVFARDWELRAVYL